MSSLPPPTEGVKSPPEPERSAESAAAEVLHLWEIDHPYYATEGNFYANGMHGQYESWDQFAQTSKGVSFNLLFMQADDARGPNLLYDFDDDLNYLWRWDWRRSDPSDYEYELAEDPTFKLPGDSLLLFFMQQRKARCNSAEIAVTEADEPAVREWLTAKARHVARTWEPFLALSTPSGSDGDA